MPRGRDADPVFRLPIVAEVAPPSWRPDLGPVAEVAGWRELRLVRE